MAQLEAMGFPTVRAQKALLATGNRNAEAAMEWLFAHMDDSGLSFFFLVSLSCWNFDLWDVGSDIDAPIAVGGDGKVQGEAEPPAEKVALIQDMGFTAAQGKKALRET
ncbi:hypothetical protein C0993_010159, partial [Termitomyces sp. T159_Od127]